MDDKIKEVMGLVVAMSDADFAAGVRTEKGDYAGAAEKESESSKLERLIESKLRELVPGWLPIESAPRDGTLILVKEDRCSGMAAKYSGGWKYESGSICYLEPTHWMPLP